MQYVRDACIIILENFDSCSDKRKRMFRETARILSIPFFSRLSSRFLDFLPVWPRLNYRKPCFGCHGRIPISRRMARVAGTPYGVSRILYEFLSWNDSFICLSSIPSPPPAPLPSLARSSRFSPLSPSPLRRLARHQHRRKSLYPYLPLFSSDRTPNLESLLSGTGWLD